MSENRTYNNPAGNFVHLNDLNPGPIEPTPQMAVQLSADAPPVEDPDFIPASMQELKAAAARISQEVPPDQAEFFYRSLHKLLDATLDGYNAPTQNSEAYEAYNGVASEMAATSDAMNITCISDSVVSSITENNESFEWGGTVGSEVYSSDPSGSVKALVSIL